MTDDVKDYIAQRIKEIRITNELSQEQFGAKFNPPRSKATVSSWEHCRTCPDANSLLEICVLFHVSISSFYPVPDEAQTKQMSLTEDEQELVNLYRRTTNRCKKALIAHARANVEDDTDCEE